MIRRCHRLRSSAPGARGQAARGSRAARAPSRAAHTTTSEDARYVLGTYARMPLSIVRGKGTKVWDEDGREYLDFASGIAVNALGHSDDGWVRAIVEQASLLSHTSNLYLTKPQTDLARRIVGLSPGLDRVFFCNSGTEANEAAIKFARRFYFDEETGAQPRKRLLSFEGAFHGRSLGALSITPKVAIQRPFAPLGIAGDHVLKAKYNDVAGIGELVDDTVAAVFVEAVQGEGGIREATPEFLAAVREACDRAGALLVLDEVQAGFGRTGSVWGHADRVRPDIVTVAKPLAGGLPIGACIVSDEVAGRMRPGDHGSTFAGNPLVCAAALEVLNRVFGPEGGDPNEAGLLPQVRERGRLLRELLRAEVAARYPDRVAEVRGRGLLVGLALRPEFEVGSFCRRALANGLMLPSSGLNTARFLPPLNVSEAEIRDAVRIAADAVGELK